jgi:predicted NBD/HSP70 family sugar kinase
MRYFLAVDIGDTAIKSGLHDGQGREKAVASEPTCRSSSTSAGANGT